MSTLDSVRQYNDLARRILEYMQVGGMAPGVHSSGRVDEPYRSLVNRYLGGAPQRAGSPTLTSTPTGEPGTVPRMADHMLGRENGTLPTPPIPPTRSSGSAALTPAANQPRAGDGEAASVAGESATTTNSQQQPGDDRANQTIWDRLQDFGFAMAASRNPSLFGQIGEAGTATNAIRRTEDRANRREALQSRELDIQQNYRQTQMELARAEMEWQRDPNNPINTLRLAQARAAAQRAEGGGGGRGGNRIVGQIVGEDGVLYGTTRDGNVVPYRTADGNPFRRGDTENWQAQWTATRNAAMQRLSQPGSPGFALSEPDRQQRASDEADAAISRMRQTLRRPGQNTGRDEGVTAPTAPTPNRTRITYQQ